MKKLGTEQKKYALYGFIFGIFFPVIGTIFECYYRGMGMNWEQIISCQKLSPSLWLVDTAPIVLGIVSSFAGRQLDFIKLKNEEINQRYQQMAELREIADQANKTKSEFLANMSHEIRTPMNAIIGMSYLMKKTSLDEKQKDYNLKSEVSAKNLLRIIDDILDFSKIEAGKLSLEITHLYLDELIADVASAVNVKLQKKKMVELVTHIDTAIPPVLMGDSVRLRQVLLNLTDNAAKFTEKGEVKLTVKVLQKKDNGITLQFSIKDTGIGLTPEAINNLFQPFQQADLSTTRKYGGTGLGLAISRSIVELMEGELNVVSTPGVGSEFIFSAYFSFEQSNNNAIEQIQSIKGMKVLLVDDSESARMVLKEMLSSLGFIVFVAEDASEALAIYETEQASSQPFNLLVIDWQMPGMDGLQLVNEFRNYSGNTIPSVLMVTAYGLETVKQAEKNQIVDGLIVKPVNQSSLYEMVNKLLHLGKKKLEETPRIEDDINSYSSYLEGKKILVVEDNEINLELAIELLNDVGIVIDTAENGLIAVQKVNENKYDLVLMDIQMPEMDGLTATKKIREEFGIKNLPILAMTAHAMKGEREKSIAAGMNDHITKPIDPILLYDTLVKFIGKKDIVESINLSPKLKESIPSKIIHIEGIETEMGLKRAASKEAVYFKLLKTFVGNYSNFSINSQELISTNQISQAGMLLHTLAGVAGNIGIKEIYDLAQKLNADLNNHIQAGNSSFLETHQLKMNELQSILEIYIERIQQFLSENESEKNETISIVKEELDKLLIELTSYIKDNDSVAVEKCQHIIDSFKLSDLEQVKIEATLNALNNFDFDEALKIIEK